ncbi:protein MICRORCHIDIA 6-like isoform X1 [Cynara cardunculus var. scolymus]|uniref:Histidine kinase-like ATPase, ATP-binding domain-containing protein n=1 Tax=Cynara cardunculus var. scolymus TaxID=59895 RepID=A0A103YC11_CYNCS|nr:protein MICRORCHIDIA 6-like isoform X1 [Cynara cardunculus var. scolymus]XP_024970603.1 protein MICRORCHIDIA 6-like isoform X1 [Cynara cardunculus var. scolymus]KVI06309.1 Histidine kinase-like ATPase, ATP-binding domain-containing protein [Cynara cardunculus var. scolymus]
MDIAEFFRDNGDVELDMGAVKSERNLGGISSHQKQDYTDVALHKKSKIHGVRQEAEENRSSSGISVLDQARSPVDDASLCSTSPICAAPLCRQFWKAGAYNDDLTPKSTTKSGSSYLHIHPKFLHSNATSHKWAFGAIAELIDNAVDEIQKEATYVIIDKAINPRNGSTALLIQDDGGGMDPEAMRRCLSFGFSDKKSAFAIGKYGNGFKTSTMRLGADVIVFSRYLTDRTLTQSIGLLSYTFLTRAGYDRIVVPMVHYEFNFMTGSFDPLQSESKDKPNVNLSILLKWSPYSTEEELLKQFEDVGSHGTKVVIYNLWLDEDGNMELDFESDPEDICISWDGKGKVKEGSRMAASEQHVAKRLRYSLRAYLSVLYLKLPDTFAMVLRGKVVLYHNIATDLKHTEFILYKPHSAGCAEGAVVTTIGFLKEAPNVNIHGFNIYHKNRLILPFWPVVVFSDSRGRGVAGVLEANFIEPTHNKQDFEKTSVFQKLITRLKEMTWEYWDYHCGLIGYQIKKKARPPSDDPGSSNFVHQHVVDQSNFRKGTSDGGATKKASFVATVNSKAALYSSSSFVKPVELIPNIPRGFEEGATFLKRKSRDQGERLHQLDAQMESGIGSKTTTTGFVNNGEAVNVIEENKKLKAQCLEYEKSQEELNHKVLRLKMELGDVEREYTYLMDELRYLEKVKGEK